MLHEQSAIHFQTKKDLLNLHPRTKGADGIFNWGDQAVGGGGGGLFESESETKNRSPIHTYQ